MAEPALKPAVPVTVESAADAFAKVVATAGDSLHRDGVDKRLIEEVQSLGTKGAIEKTEADVGGQGEIQGGTAATSSARDGIPDEWKLAHHLDPKDANLYKATQPSLGGYTYLEEYLNGLAGDEDRKP